MKSLIAKYQLTFTPFSFLAAVDNGKCFCNPREKRVTLLKPPASTWQNLDRSPGGGGGTPLYGLYGDVPLDRVWFLASLP